jgi:hypothetical protein
MKKTIVISVFAIIMVVIAVWLTGSLIDKLLPAQAENGKNVVELISSIGWLIIILVALLALFQPLSTFLEGISSRITKVSAFDVSIEIAQLSEYTPTWSKVGDNDVRKISPQYVFDSYSYTLFQEITEKTPADYAIIDLGDGEEWLTSRLFLFAIMLERMRGLKAFVFVASINDCPKCYVGTATTSRIRWSLAHQYQWFEKSFSKAYAGTFIPPNPPQILLKDGKMDDQMARNIAQNFIQDIQQPVEPTENKEQWISVQKPQPLWENAKWIDVALLKKVLGNSLYTGSVSHSIFDTPQQQAKKIAAFDEPLVAFTNSDKVFHSLVDRQALLEAIAIRALSFTSESKNE